MTQITDSYEQRCIIISCRCAKQLMTDDHKLCPVVISWYLKYGRHRPNKTETVIGMIYSCLLLMTRENGGRDCVKAYCRTWEDGGREWGRAYCRAWGDADDTGERRIEGRGGMADEIGEKRIGDRGPHTWIQLEKAIIT